MSTEQFKMKFNHRKPKILLLADDLRMHSGIATMAREIVMGTCQHFYWVQIAGAISHPDKGKVLDLTDATKKFVRDGKQQVMNTENIGKVQAKPVETVDDSSMIELAVAHEALAEENAKLMDMLAVKQMDATPEEKAKAQETLESLRADVKRLEAELHAVKISRDQLQSKTSEMQKQINYWRKKAEKVAA
jgi:hypothetical protein